MCMILAPLPSTLGGAKCCTRAHDLGTGSTASAWGVSMRIQDTRRNGRMRVAVCPGREGTLKLPLAGSSCFTWQRTPPCELFEATPCGSRHASSMCQLAPSCSELGIGSYFSSESFCFLAAAALPCSERQFARGIHHASFGTLGEEKSIESAKNYAKN